MPSLKTINQEKECISGMDRLQVECIPFIDTQMPPDVQDSLSTDNIHKARYDSLED